jgi:FtsP/CotA-like multicopper oxidase with cupredoxin domain
MKPGRVDWASPFVVSDLRATPRFRFMNEGMMAHPAHLHGLTLEVFARDGYPLPQPFRCDTLNVAPGERWDAIVVADEAGVWAFHGHILNHAEGPTGMFGMVDLARTWAAPPSPV